MDIRRLAALVGAAAIVLGSLLDAAERRAHRRGGSGRRPQRGSPRGRSAAASGCTVGVSWNNFQQPRWAAHDQPNIQKTVEAGGGTYIDADANLPASSS